MTVKRLMEQLEAISSRGNEDKEVMIALDGEGLFDTFLPAVKIKGIYSDAEWERGKVYIRAEKEITLKK